MTTDLSAFPYEEARIIYWLERSEGRLTRGQLRRKMPSPKKWAAYEPALQSLIDKGFIETYLDRHALFERETSPGRAPRVYRLVERADG